MNKSAPHLFRPGVHAGKTSVLVAAIALALVTALGYGAPAALAADVSYSMVRKPMPKPDPEMFRPKEKKLEFFFLAQAEQRKDILSVTLIFKLKNQPALDRFSSQTRELCDEIYRFLIAYRPDRNTMRNWQSFIQNDLVKHLNTTHPKMDLVAITVDQFQRI
jgi:hypothetical protein